VRRRTVGALGSAVVAVAALGAACSASAGGPVAQAAAKPPAPKLVRFDSCDRFLGTVRARALERVGPWGIGTTGPMLGMVPEGAVADRASAPAASGAAAPREGVDFSGTNLQEAGVDEPDMVKTDGRTIYSIADGGVRVTDISGGAPPSAIE